MKRSSERKQELKHTWGACSYLSGRSSTGHGCSNIRDTLAPPSEIQSSLWAVLSSRERGIQSARTHGHGKVNKPLTLLTLSPFRKLHRVGVKWALSKRPPESGTPTPSSSKRREINMAALGISSTSYLSIRCSVQTCSLIQPTTHSLPITVSRTKTHITQQWRTLPYVSSAPLWSRVRERQLCTAAVPLWRRQEKKQNHWILLTLIQTRGHFYS